MMTLITSCGCETRGSRRVNFIWCRGGKVDYYDVITKSNGKQTFGKEAIARCYDGLMRW